MNFDVVIGNPPYNNDIYLTFVGLSYEISNLCSCMITPARWQAKGGKENEIFREKIVPYIENIVYYQDCGDIFNIRMKGGVTYYLIDKSLHNSKKIINCCERVKEFTEETIERAFDNIIFLGSSNIYNICKKIGCFDKNFKYFQPTWKAYENNYNVFISTVNADAGGKTSFHIFSNDGNMTVIAPLIIMQTTTFLTPDIKCIFSSPSKEVCENFISWINTKLIRFLILMRCCSYHNDNDFTWRFVPEQQEFNHRFTDKELYKQYSLTQGEINIIEKVIKER